MLTRGNMRSSMIALSLVASFAITLASAGCHRAPVAVVPDRVTTDGSSGASSSSRIAAASAPPAADPAGFADRARFVLAAIRARNFAALATAVHPTRGVRFSPYAYVQPGVDLVLTADDVRNATLDREDRVWGSQDGTGSPIRMTIAKYFDRYVYDVDFAATPEISYDKRKPLGSGNTTNNLADVYPTASVMELFVPGVDPKYGGMDWRSLRLVLEREGATWWLVGVVHDEWTI